MNIDDIVLAKTLEELERLRIHYLGKSGVLTEQMKGLNQLSPEEKKAKGLALNQQKEIIQNALQERKSYLEAELLNQQLQSQWCDISLPGRQHKTGTRHPLSQTMDIISQYFQTKGFIVKEGPEMEDDFHNFDL